MKNIANDFSFIKYAELKLEKDFSISTIDAENKHNVIYAISVDNVLQYIGKTKNLKKRINYYRTAINRINQTSDSIKSTKIFDALMQGKKVEFWSRQCFNLCLKNELGEMSVSTMDLEEPIFIKKLNPPWNTQHKRKC